MYIHNLIITLNYIAIWAKLFCKRWIYSSITQSEPHLTTQSKVNTGSSLTTNLDMNAWFGWLQCNGVISTSHKGAYNCYSHW